MDDLIQPGNNAGRGLTVTINEPFLKTLTGEQAHAYIAAIAHAGRIAPLMSGEDLTTWLARELAQADIAVPEPEFNALVELLASSPGEVSVVTDSGQVLAGNPSAGPLSNEPDVHGTQDPEHPDRPVYS